MIMSRVAIYCRLSEEDHDKKHADDDSNSIQNQKTMLLQYALQQDWEITGVYSDDDYSGANRNRPDFNRMIADAKNRKFDIILCKTQSRFARDVELIEKYIHGLFPQWGIRFKSLVDNVDTASSGNKKARQITALSDEWYIEGLSENVRSVLTSRRKNGFHIGSFALYGYRKDPDQKGHLLIDEEAAAVVREVFTLYAQGHGKTWIAKMLNDRGIPNPTEYKRLQGLRYQQPKGKTSTLWKYTSISDMLKNETYIGNLVQGKYGSISYKTKKNRPRPKEEWYRVENTHDPIIERELWDRVQAMQAERAKPFVVGKIGLFARKARCAGCGAVMRSSKTKDRYYLRCSNQHIAKDACEGASIAVNRLEKMVLAELNRLISTYLDQDEFEQNIEFCKGLNEKKARIMREIANAEKKTEELSKAIRELYLDKVKGIISEADYIAMSRDFSAEKERFERSIETGKTQVSEIEAQIAAGDNRRELLRQYTNLDHLTREIVENLIDHISVDKRIPGSLEVPIEIHWNF